MKYLDSVVYTGKASALLLVLMFFGSEMNSQASFSRSLEKALGARQEGIVDVHLVFDTQVNFGTWNREQEAARSSYSDRSQRLLSLLQANANATQPSWIALLQQTEGVDAASIRRHTIVNAISCRITYDALRRLASLPGIKWIGENRALKQVSTDMESEASMVIPDGREKGLSAIGAPDMWKLGYTGYNRLAFIADTGTDPTHPAIRRQYNGLTSSEKASWYSLENNAGPYDCNRHGTHVTGTVLGLDRLLNDTIGVAFNARWIAGDILCGIGTADNIGAFEWALNPDGDPGTTNDIPDVINNSWYDPSLDTLDCYSVYVPVLEALEAAGVAVIFSAGNAGPDPGTITQPHNINVNELNAFTVGALNGNGTNLGIASFSSTGPSHCPGEGSLKIKPEVSAPGVLVRSCVPGNTYTQLSGTSMAAPHVAGAVLLLKEAFPYLGGKEIKHALYHSCRDLGEPGEDNKYGMGIINVYQAYLFLLSKGHVPVSPLVRNDISLLDIQHAVNACDRTLRPSLLIENNGTDTLRQFSLFFSSESWDTLVVWAGIVAPGQRTTLFPVLENVPTGVRIIQVDADLPNGEDDPRKMHNRFTFEVNITEEESQAVLFPFEGQVCVGSDFYLESPGLQGGTPITTNWYDAPYGGSLVQQGNRIRIKNPGELTRLFAEPIYRESLRQTELSLSDGYYPDSLEDGIVFDVHAQITLDSVAVYSQQVGIRNFYLYNQRGDSLTSTRKFINKIGVNQVKLNWVIPPGKGYRLIRKDGKPLLSIPAPGYFPATSEQGVITLADGTTKDQFSGFFNWRYTYAEPCGRLAVDWRIREDSLAQRADIALSEDTIYWPDQVYVTFRSTSGSALTHTWDTGDGNTYFLPEVTHAFSQPGSYNIVLQMTDSLGCVSTANKTVHVLLRSSTNAIVPGTGGGLLIYPNPGSNTVSVYYPEGAWLNPRLQIFAASGQPVLEKQFSGYTSQLSADTSGLLPGVYIISVTSGEKTSTGRWLRL